MSAAALQNTKKKEYSCIYKLFCTLVLFFGLLYRCIRKCCKGKVSAKLQPVLSLLAFGCIGSVCLLPSALEQELLSFGQTALLSMLLLLGFTCFAGMAGAFRPYRYLKKKQKLASKQKLLPISPSSSEQHTKIA